MSGWTHEELRSVETTDDFRVAPYREDGRTPGTSIWVWAAVVDGVIYVRTSNPTSRWFAAAVNQGAGHAGVHGQTRPVAFRHVIDGRVIDRVDAAFTAKYANDPYFSVAILANSRTRVVGLVPTENRLENRRTL